MFLKGYKIVYFSLIILKIVSLIDGNKVLTIMANNHNTIINKCKYLTLKITKVREDIKFNKQCLHHNVIPNYVQINTKLKTRAATKTLTIAKKIWVKEEINSHYIKLNSLKEDLENLKQDMAYFSIMKL